MTMSGHSKLAADFGDTLEAVRDQRAELFGRRYSPSQAAALQPMILAALAEGEWRNVAAICAKLRRASDDGVIRYAVKRLADAELIERKSEPLPRSRTGFTYLYRRRPMTDRRPRTFLWHSVMGIPFPQIVYDDPRVGCAGLAPISGTERPLHDDDPRTLTQLASDYPAPKTETV